MLKIRLQRIGKVGQAYFRLVVIEHTRRPKGVYLELLGSYDPHKKVFRGKAERIAYWLGQGVQASPTAHNLLVNNGLLKAEKVKAWKPKKKAAAPEKAAPAPAPAA